VFDEWRERRRLKRQISDIMRRYRPKLSAAASDEDRESIEAERDSELAYPLVAIANMAL
jgi:hypothetical protein